MSLTRRSFLSRSALGALGFAIPTDAFAVKSTSTGRFGLHPFVESHPEAVFVMRTNVDHKLNDRAKRDAGLSFGRSVFVPLGEGGFNPATVFPVKLNLKTIDAEKYPLEHILGTITDPFFSEGMFEAMKERGVAANRIKVRENDRGNSFAPYGLIDMRTAPASISAPTSPERSPANSSRATISTGQRSRTAAGSERCPTSTPSTVPAHGSSTSRNSRRTAWD